MNGFERTAEIRRYMACLRTSGLLLALGTAACDRDDLSAEVFDADAHMQVLDGSRIDDASTELSFERIPVPPEVNECTSVWVAANGNFWIGTYDGIWSFDGAWHHTLAGYLVTDLWGDENGPLIAGLQAQIWLLGTSGWTHAVTLDSCVSDVKVFATTDGTVYGACSNYTGVVRFEAADPASAEHNDDYALSASAIWALGPEVLAITSVGVRRYVGGAWEAAKSWSLDTSLTALGAAWSAVPDELVAAGVGGKIFRRSAGLWSPESSGITANIASLWGSAQDGLFAVAEQGTIIHRGITEDTWTRLDAQDATGDLRAVRGSPGGQVIIVGQNRLVLRLVR